MNGVSESVACTTFFYEFNWNKNYNTAGYTLYLYTFYNKMVHDDSFLFRK